MAVPKCLSIINNILMLSLTAIAATLLRQVLISSPEHKKKSTVDFTVENGHISIAGPYAYLNFFGCVIFGLAHTIYKEYPNFWKRHEILYLGITTGFCGSLTSFATTALSSIVLVLFKPIEISFFFYAWLTMFGTSFIGFAFGTHIGTLIIYLGHFSYLKLQLSKKKVNKIIIENVVLPTSLTKQDDLSTTQHSEKVEKIYFSILVSMNIIIIICFIASLLFHSQHLFQLNIITPASFSILGVSLRYALSFLNSCGKKPSTIEFPIGTFLANCISTPLYCTCLMILNSHSWNISVTPGSYSITTYILYGVSFGFCSSLGSFSMWIYELSVAMKNISFRYIYGIITIIACVGLSFPCVILIHTL